MNLHIYIPVQADILIIKDGLQLVEYQKLNKLTNLCSIMASHFDGLAAFRNMGPRTADKVRKRFVDCFAEFGLKITIQTNLKIVNYLDISLNLINGTYQPYRKPENAPLFIHNDSNHPPSIKKQVPISIYSKIPGSNIYIYIYIYIQ